MKRGGRRASSLLALPYHWAPPQSPLNLIALILAVGVPAALLGLALHFYLGVDALRALSFWADERTLAGLISDRMPGNAPVLTGVHLFGDFALPYYWVSLPDPWSSDPQMVVDYLPPVLLIFSGLSAFGSGSALVLYLVGMTVCLLVPCWWALAGQPLAVRIIGTTVIGLLTGPALASLDRGNTQGFLPLLLFGFAVGVLSRRWWLASLCLIGAVTMKVVPILLIVVLLARRQWWWAGVTILLTGVISLGTMPLVTDDPMGALPALVRNMLGFGVVQTTYETFMSYNVSMLGGLAQAAVGIGLPGLSVVVWEHAGSIGALYFVAVLPLLLSNRLELWIRLVLAFACLTAVVPIAYPYALNWTIAAAAVIFLMSQGGRGVEPMHGAVSKYLVTVVVLLVGLLAVPYPIFIPGSEAAGHPASILGLANAALMLAVPAALYVWLLRAHLVPVAGMQRTGPRT
ncbi:MAG: hypothetical protein KGN78_11640 [Actinomycetales bacterium]|nr:hypothetical protein [Actinomycetales bacterium]